MLLCTKSSLEGERGSSPWVGPPQATTSTSHDAAFSFTKLRQFHRLERVLAVKNRAFDFEFNHIQFTAIHVSKIHSSCGR